MVTGIKESSGCPFSFWLECTNTELQSPPEFPPVLSSYLGNIVIPSRWKPSHGRSELMFLARLSRSCVPFRQVCLSLPRTGLPQPAARTIPCAVTGVHPHALHPKAPLMALQDQHMKLPPFHTLSLINRPY